MVFEGAVRHPPSVPVQSLFRRFLHAVPLRPGWLRPGRALAALVLAACRALAAGCEALASLLSGFRRYR